MYVCCMIQLLQGYPNVTGVGIVMPIALAMPVSVMLRMLGTSANTVPLATTDYPRN